MTLPPGVKEVSAGYGELALVEMPAIDLLTSLGWSFKNLYAETFGALARLCHPPVHFWPTSTVNPCQH